MTTSFSIANGDSDVLHELKCNNCGGRWSCTCGSMRLHEDSADLNRCPLCSRTCLHCGQARVTGRWSELCADCVALVRRENQIFLNGDDYLPNEDDALGPDVRGDLLEPKAR